MTEQDAITLNETLARIAAALERIAAVLDPPTTIAGPDVNALRAQMGDMLQATKRGDLEWEYCVIETGRSFGDDDDAIKWAWSGGWKFFAHGDDSGDIAIYRRRKEARP